MPSIKQAFAICFLSVALTTPHSANAQVLNGLRWWPHGSDWAQPCDGQCGQTSFHGTDGFHVDSRGLIQDEMDPSELWQSLAMLPLRNEGFESTPAALSLHAMDRPSDRLVSDDSPASSATLAYSALELAVHIPYVSNADIDAIRIWLDGKQLQPGELQEIGRQLVLRNQLTVQQVSYRWDCPPLGRHRIQVTYLRKNRWSPISQPVRFEIQPPPTPQIIAIAQGEQQPRPIHSHFATKINGSATLKLSGVKPNDKVAVELGGEQFVEAMVGMDCCVTVQLGQLAPSGRYALTVRNLTNNGCGLSSKPSRRVWIDFFDAKAMVEIHDLIGDRPLQFQLEQIAELPTLVPAPIAVADVPLNPIDAEPCDVFDPDHQFDISPPNTEPVQGDVRNGPRSHHQFAAAWQDEPSDDSSDEGVRSTDEATSDDMPIFPSVFPSVNVTGAFSLPMQTHASEAIAMATTAKMDFEQTKAAHLAAKSKAIELAKEAKTLTQAAVNAQSRSIEIAQARASAAANAAAKTELASELGKALEDLRHQAASATKAAAAAQKLWLSKIEAAMPSAEASVAYQIAAQSAKEKHEAVRQALQNAAAAKSDAADAVASSVEAAKQAERAASEAATAKQEAIKAVGAAERERDRADHLGILAAGKASLAESASGLAHDAVKKEDALIADPVKTLTGEVDPVGAMKRMIVGTESTAEIRQRIKFLLSATEKLSERLDSENKLIYEGQLEIDGATGEVISRMLELDQIAEEICEQAQLIRHYRSLAMLSDQEKARIDRQNQLLNKKIQLVLDFKRSLRVETLEKLLSLFLDAGILSPDQLQGDNSAVLNDAGGSSRSQSAAEASDVALQRAFRSIKKLYITTSEPSVQIQLANPPASLPQATLQRAEVRRGALGLVYEPDVDAELKSDEFRPIAQASALHSAKIRERDGETENEMRMVQLLVESSRMELSTLKTIAELNNSPRSQYPDAAAVAKQKTLLEVADAIVTQREREHATAKSDQSRKALEGAKDLQRSAYQAFQVIQASHDAMVKIAKQATAVSQATAALKSAKEVAARRATKSNLDAVTKANDLLNLRQQTLSELESKLPAATVLANVQAERILGVRERLKQIQSQLEHVLVQMKSRLESIATERILIDRIAGSVDDLRIADDSKRVYMRNILEQAREEAKQWRSLNSMEGARLYQELARVKDFSNEHQHRMDVAKQISDTKLKNDQAIERSANGLAKDYWDRVQSRQNARDALRANAPPTKTHFHSPAHFPIPRFGSRGLDDAREGMTISEGMQLITRADGTWSLEYQVQRAKIPVTLAMQIQFRTSENGPWHTITLRPQNLSPGTDFINTIAFSDLTQADFEDHQFVTVRQKGKHPALAAHGGKIVEVRRRGNARYGFGYRGLDMYGPLATK